MANVGPVSPPTPHADGRTRRWRPKRLGLLVILVGCALAVGGCNYPAFGEARGADVQGQEVSKLYSGMFVSGLIVAVLVWGLIAWCVVFYRRRRRGEGVPKQFQEHIPLEIAYTVIPLIIVIVIFVFTVITENEVDAVSKRPAVTVNVTGYQWGWIFKYENSHGVTLHTLGAVRYLPDAKGYAAKVYPQLVLPLGKATRINLRSDDVIHDFYVHAFDFDRFAQPGITNSFEFTPTERGVFPAQCVEYCGLYHSEMLFSVRVISYPQFRAWLRYQEHHPNTVPKHYPITQS